MNATQLESASSACEQTMVRSITRVRHSGICEQCGNAASRSKALCECCSEWLADRAEFERDEAADTGLVLLAPEHHDDAGHCTQTSARRS